jgi:leucyl/phenylalanyl-tRNA--protein transferase
MDEPFTVELVLKAYSIGIFPMGNEDGSISWYSPDPRCIIDLDDFHIPKRLARTYRQKQFDLRVNTAWNDVLLACANRERTWISKPVIDVYTQLHKLGYAHTVEAFENDQLVGGLYGLSLGGAFMGESMFHTVRDASKVCLVYLVERLKERNYTLLDCQYMTSHLNIFGAKDIRNREYLARLKKALPLDCHFA